MKSELTVIAALILISICEVFICINQNAKIIHMLKAGTDSCVVTR